jgi:hypothetical protein
LPAVTVAFVLVTAPPADGLILLGAGSGSVLSPFGPNKTATGTGSVTATDNNPSWTLQAQDQGSGAGKMVANASGCGGSDATLANPLELSVASPLGGITSAGTISLSGANQTVATASNQPVAGVAFTTNYTQVVPPTEKMLVGCVYSITVTYTLQ